MLFQRRRRPLKKLIRKAAERHRLDPRLVACIILQESGGNTAAFRYEPGFYRMYVEGKGRADLLGHVPAKLPTLMTEKKARAHSWGLMQIMGQTAREHDFEDDYLTELCIHPRKGIEWGCRYLAWCLERKSGNTEQALLKYNGGGNPNYSDEVMDRWIKQEYWELL